MTDRISPLPSLPEVGLLELLCVRDGRSAARTRAAALETARLAERLGYGRIWVTEHHSRMAASTNPLLWLAAIAATTERIRIGTAVSLLRIREPHLLAEDVATVSAIAGDRVDLGVGRGDVRGPGTEVLDPIRCDDDDFEAAHRELERALAGECPWIAPPPERVRAWMHGAGTRTAEVAAERGADYCHGLFFNPDEETCRAALEFHALRRPHARRAVAIAAVVGEDPARVERDARIEGVRLDLVGTPAACATRIRQLLEDLPIDEVVLAEQSDDPADHAAALEEIAHLLRNDASTAAPTARAEAVPA